MITKKCCYSCPSGCLHFQTKLLQFCSSKVLDWESKLINILSTLAPCIKLTYVFDQDANKPRIKEYLQQFLGKQDWSNQHLHFPVSHYTDCVYQQHSPNNFHKEKKIINLFKSTALMIFIPLSLP